MKELNEKIKELYQRKGYILNRIEELKTAIEFSKEENMDYLEDEMILEELREEIRKLNQKIETLEKAMMIIVGLE